MIIHLCRRLPECANQHRSNKPRILITLPRLLDITISYLMEPGISLTIQSERLKRSNDLRKPELEGWRRWQRRIMACYKSFPARIFVNEMERFVAASIDMKSGLRTNITCGSVM